MRISVLFTCLVCVTIGTYKSARAADKPNIVFILADDLGWTDLACYGSHYYETPHIDRLASEGVRFTAAYSNGPNCAPTRACLMSGQYSPRHGVFTVGTSERGQARLRRLIPTPNKTQLAGEFVTIAEALFAAGYKTCHVGKWQLGNSEATRTIAQGFGLSIGSDIAIGRVGHFSPYGSRELADGPAGEYLTDRLTDEAIAFIRKQRDGPFFLYFAHHAVHTPIRAKDELIARFRAKSPAGGHNDPVYSAMIASLDESVGRVVREIDELGIAGDTLIVFFSDNGGHAAYTSNAPLRGSKGMLYEGGIRVPMVVRWPGHAPAASTCNEPVIGVDFYPTLLEVAGSDAPQGPRLDGASLVKLFTQPLATLDRQAIFWHFPAYLEPYTREQGPWRTTPGSAIRMGSWKLHEFFEDGRLELYNLAEDVGETMNLVEQLPDKRDELQAALQLWRRQVNAPVPTELNSDYHP